jgi:putative transcriptional regulator
MSDKKQYKSEALASIHETMGALHQIGAIDKKTMRNFDTDCLEVIS